MTKTGSAAGRASAEHVVVLRLPSPASVVRNALASVAMRRALTAELLGTLLFIFLAAGTAAATAAAAVDRTSAARVLVVALAHGLAFGLAIAASARLSGGHLNPAITVAVVAGGRMPSTVGALYALAQLMGAVGAALLLKLVVPSAGTSDLGAHALGARVAPGAAVVIEAVLTFALVLAYLATARGPGRSVAPFALGATVTLAHLFAMPLTGASMNPARTFGPALVAGAWASHWVYWLGPLLGGGLAALAWKWAFADGAAPDAAQLSLNGDDSWRRPGRPTR